MKRLLVTALMLAFVAAVSLNTAGIASADDTLNKMGHKLYRGVANVASGWMELPKTIQDESKAHDLGTGLIWGSMKGSGKAAVRTAAGGYDAGTFLFPVPKDYEPVLEPEFVY